MPRGDPDTPSTPFGFLNILYYVGQILAPRPLWQLACGRVAHNLRECTVQANKVCVEGQMFSGARETGGYLLETVIFPDFSHRTNSTLVLSATSHLSSALARTDARRRGSKVFGAGCVCRRTRSECIVSLSTYVWHTKAYVCLWPCLCRDFGRHVITLLRSWESLLLWRAASFRICL